MFWNQSHSFCDLKLYVEEDCLEGHRLGSCVEVRARTNSIIGVEGPGINLVGVYSPSACD